MYLWSSHLLSYSFQSLSLQYTLARWNRTSSLLRFIHTQVILSIHPTDGAFGVCWFILEPGPISNGGKWGSNPILCAVGKSQAINSHACCNPTLSHKETTWVDWKFSIKEAAALPKGSPPSPPSWMLLAAAACTQELFFISKGLKIQLILKKTNSSVNTGYPPSSFLVFLFTSFVVRTKILQERPIIEKGIPTVVFLLLWIFFRNVKNGRFLEFQDR
jgi:hypothetical protein